MAVLGATTLHECSPHQGGVGSVIKDAARQLGPAAGARVPHSALVASHNSIGGALATARMTPVPGAASLVALLGAVPVLRFLTRAAPTLVTVDP